MKTLYVFWIAFFVSACASNPPMRPSGEAGRDIFPDGRYIQDVVVKVTAPTFKQDFDFSAVVAKSPNDLQFIGYNAFGISLFKIKQRGNDEPTVETSIKQIEERRDFFLKVFRLVKTIVRLPVDDPRLRKDQMEWEQDGLRSTVSFADYDSAHVPLTMKVESQGQYRVEIKTTSYKLNQ